VSDDTPSALNAKRGEVDMTSASPRRVRLLAGILCAAAAVGLLAFTLTRGGADKPVLETTNAVLDPALLPAGAEVPTAPTIAPIEEETQPVDTLPSPPTTIELSPLAAQVGETFSVIPQPVVDLPIPIDIRIDAIGIDTDPVIPVGLTEEGDLDVPGADDVGWYQYGQTADQPGATVLAAHVNWKGKLGVFSQLGNLEPGSEIFVTLSDGTQRKYVAWERAVIDKTNLPYDRIWTREGEEVLVLITCGGEYNPEIRRYKQNIVVFAVPVPFDA
jgi:LPXTG-site transpeptidase (sortase) family protein